MKEPVIKIVSGPSVVGQGLGIAAAAGLSYFGSAFSKAADLLPFDPEELFGVLHFRIYEAKQSQKRAKWIGGRIYNRFSGS